MFSVSAASGEPSCQLTTSERCRIGSSSGGCVSNENATRFPAFPDDNGGHYYCKVNPDYGYWARCDIGCLHDSGGKKNHIFWNIWLIFWPFSEPMQFENDDDPMAVMCKTVPMECQFPFTHSGNTYHECTNSPLSNDEAYDTDEEDFFWCATQVDADGNMVTGQWGVCDFDSCKDPAEDSSDTEQMIEEVEPRSKFSTFSLKLSL